MGNFGVVHLFVLFLAVVVPMICFWKILPRAGFSKYYAIFAVIPVGTVVLLFALAFKEWPGDESVEA